MYSIVKAENKVLLINREDNKLARINGMIFYGNIGDLIDNFNQHHDKISWEKTISPNMIFFNKGQEISYFENHDEFLTIYSDLLI